MTIDKNVLLAYGCVKGKLTRCEFTEGSLWRSTLVS